MSPGRDLPGYPRQKLRSHAEAEPIPERVYEVLQGFDTRIGGLEGQMGELKEDSRENKRQNAQIISKLEDIKATDRHALTKLVIGFATTAVVTIGGILGGMQAFKAPAAAPAPIQRSALDVKLDVCRPIQEPGSRAECFSRVFEAEAVK